MIANLVDKRYNSFEFFGVEFVRKLFLVLMVDRVGSWHEVAATEPEEEESGNRPGEDSKTEPLGDFTQIVGAGNVPVETLLGQVVVGVTRFAQMANDMIGMHVDNPAREEDDGTDNELRRAQPFGCVHLRIILRREMEEPEALDITVDEVPDNRKEHDDHRHFAFSLQKEGEDE